MDTPQIVRAVDRGGRPGVIPKSIHPIYAYLIKESWQVRAGVVIGPRGGGIDIASRAGGNGRRCCPRVAISGFMPQFYSHLHPPLRSSSPPSPPFQSRSGADEAREAPDLLADSGGDCRHRYAVTIRQGGPVSGVRPSTPFLVSLSRLLPFLRRRWVGCRCRLLPALYICERLFRSNL